MCDCFHLAFPNWHAASSGTAGRRLQAPEPATEDDSICEEPAQFAEGERPRPQGSSPVQEYPEAAKYLDSDKECEDENDPDPKVGSGHKGKKSGLGSIFERTSTPKMSKSKEAHSPEGGVIVNTPKDGCGEGLVFGGGGREGIFIKKVVPESPASKSLKVKEGDQILSATVYFDNMSYEDAIQILEHAQAYKLKLCLKRQPDTSETEPTIKTDIIPEEEVCSTEMREQGKTRRRGDARISWPKFPSFGKGRKSRFTRSHSSSDADEQRKLELSPTTSDTESPIKSQDALKGKKKHKIKLPALTKRGRISSSEDQDTDAPTTGQTSSDNQQKQESDALSPESPEYAIVETQDVNVEADLKAGEVLESDQSQYKVEIINTNTTFKTTDPTVADQLNQSVTRKSPDEKKKKKERLELKMKILGKDKVNKKEAKAKSSPKRLKTLGASVDAEDLPEMGKSAVISSSESKTKLLGDQSKIGSNEKLQNGESSKVILSKSMTSQISLPKVELDISVRKSSKKVDEKTQKGKDLKQKHFKKSSPKHNRPDTDMINIATSEEMERTNDQESTIITARVSTTELPKREEIEIPGMEDMLVKSTMTGSKAKESHAETVQMSIDVDSVKEAVSKLPGFKLPQVDISGMPIPEEITVIDANAQRISVKTPTKVAKPKQEHLTGSDMTACSEISKAIFLTEIRMDSKKSPKDDKTSQTKSKKLEETMVFKGQDIASSDKGVSSSQENEFGRTNGKGDLKIQSEATTTREPPKTSIRSKITMPSFDMSAKARRLPYIGIDLQKQNFTQEKEMITEIITDERQTGEVICKGKIPELDRIEYIDSTDEQSVKKQDDLRFSTQNDRKTASEIPSEGKDKFVEPENGKNRQTKVGITTSGILSEKDNISDEGTTKPKMEKSKFKWPNLDISVPKLKGTTTDINRSKKDTVVTEGQTKGLLKTIDVYIPSENAKAEKLQKEIKQIETQGEFDWEASKFENPKVKGPEFDMSLSKKDADDKVSHVRAEGPQPEKSNMVLTPGKGNVYLLKQKMQSERPGTDIKPLQTKDDNVQGGKIKIPKLGIKTTKLTGPEINVSLLKKDAEITFPDGKPEVKLIEGLERDVNTDIFRAEERKAIEKSDLKNKSLHKESEAKGHKIKVPQFGIALPKVTMQESDLSKSKKGKDLTLPEVKGEIKDLEVNIKAPDIKVATRDVEVSSSKFKMSPSKMAGFGVDTPNLSSMVSDTQTSEDGATIDTAIPDTDQGTSPDVKTKACETDGRASRFKIPKFGISIPKRKGPETDTSLSKKLVDDNVTLPKGEAEVPGATLQSQAPQIGVQQNVDYSVSKPKIKSPFSDDKAEVKLFEVDGGKNFSSTVDLNDQPELEIKTIKAESQPDRQEGENKHTSVGLKMPKTKGAELHLGVSSKDVKAGNKVDLMPKTETKIEIPVSTVDVSLGKAEMLIPTGNMEVGKPEVQSQPIVDGQGGRFKMPKFGIRMPKSKGPEIKKDVEGTLTNSKTDNKIPDADFDVQDVEQSRSKFYIPTLKLPKLGLGTPNVTTEEHIFDKRDSTDKDIPDEVLAVTIIATSTDTEGPSIDIKTIEVDHERSFKFKIPGSDFSVPKIKGCDMDVDLTKAEKKHSDAEQTKTTIESDTKNLDIKQKSQGRFKMPTFKLPKFGVGISTTNIEDSTADKDVILDEANIEILGATDTVNSGAPGSDIEGKQMDEEMTERERKGKEIKSKMHGPDTELGSNIAVETNILKNKAKVTRPDDDLNKTSIEAPAPAPEIKVLKKDKDGSPSKFKMPTFKLPKFGVSAQSSTEEVPALDKDDNTAGGETKASGDHCPVSIEALSIDIKASSDFQKDGSENEERGRKFKLPSLGFSVSQTKGSDAENIISTTDVDVTVPGGYTEVEAKAPELKGTRVETRGSPSRFKMPTFKLPRFGLSAQSSTEVPPLDTDVKTRGDEATTSGEIFGASIEGPIIDNQGPSVVLKFTETESEGREKKLTLPSLDFSVSQTKGPDTEIILSTTDVDITVPGGKTEIKHPDEKFSSLEVEAKAPELKGTRVETGGSPSKFKMPSFKLPRFGLSAQSSTEEVAPLDTEVKTGGEHTYEETAGAGIEGEIVDIQALSVASKTTGTESEGRGKKFKLPSHVFSLSQTKGPDTEISLSTADIDVAVPEMKTEVKFTEETSLKSSEAEAKAAELKGTRVEKDGSPSKFKMPTFKFPKFWASLQSSTEEVPPFGKDVSIPGEENTISEVIAFNAEGPSIDIKHPIVELKKEKSEREEKGKKLKLPSLGFSVTHTKGADMELGLNTDVDVTEPKLKDEVKYIDDELKRKETEMETKVPEIQDVDGSTSTSKFKMPTIKFPKFGIPAQRSTEDASLFDKDFKTGVGETKDSEDVLTVTTEGPSIGIEGVSSASNIVGIEHEGRGKELELPSLSFSIPQAKGPDTDMSLKTDIDSTLPDVRAEEKLRGEKLSKSFVEVKTKALEATDIKKNTEGSSSKFKMPNFKLPKFGIGTQPSTTDEPPLDKDVKPIEGETLTSGEAIVVCTEAPTIEVKGLSSEPKPKGSDPKQKGKKFTFPSLGFSATEAKGDSNLGLSKTAVDVTLPEVTAELKLPDDDYDVKKSSTEIQTKGSENKTVTKETDGSPSKFNMPEFRLPRFGLATQSSIGEDGPLDNEKNDAVDAKAPEVTVVSKDIDGSPSKFKIPTLKLPKFGLASQSSNKPVPALEKDVRTVISENATLEEVLTVTSEGQRIELKGPSMDLKSSETVGEQKGSKFKLPSLGFSTAQAKHPSTNISLSKTDVDVKKPNVKAEIFFSDEKSKQPLVKLDVKSPENKTHAGDMESISAEAVLAPELDTSIKKSKFSLPRFSFSKPSIKNPEIKAEYPVHTIETEHAEAELITVVKQSADDDMNNRTGSETVVSEAEVKAKKVKGSPLKFKLPTLQMPRFGNASYEVTTETHSTEKIKINEGDGSQLGEGPTVTIKDSKTDVKTDAPKSVQTDHKTLNTEGESGVHESPSKFKLPTFKLPQLSLSRPKFEDESVNIEYEKKEDQLEMTTELKEENLSPKLILTSFGDILQSVDVDFDLGKVDKVDQNLETSKQSDESAEPNKNNIDTKDKETKSKQDATKGSETGSGWFKFPKFGLSSPMEQKKICDKAEQMKQSSPAGEAKDEEVSPTFSVQSSDGFADISSTITSEPVGPFLPSPSKVTLKYTGETVAVEVEEMQGDIITSTTNTELISDVPNMPEKITILSSGFSSSSEDTVRLKSGKIHIITSNIQATPESQHAKLLTALAGQSEEGFDLQTVVDADALLMVQDAQGAHSTVKHLVQEISTERSESKETLVITKQITHVFGPTEPISGETASSIQRLKDSVHSEKMRFFDEAEK